MSSIDADIDRLLSLSEDLPSSVWIELVAMIGYVLKRNWFGEEDNKAEELLQAMQNGNTERAVEIIDDQDESEDIKSTIHSMCDEVNNEEEVDHDKIQSLEKWAR